MSSESVLTSDAGEARRPDIARNATIALAGFLSVLAAIRYGIHAETLVMIFFICVLVAISRVDLERRIIPNRIVVPAWIAVLLAHLAIHPHHWVQWLVASFGAGFFFLAVSVWVTSSSRS
jgi:prepilin signal peptidase PulO-like enzyme (type II secretory pathway)